jgi:hypothetical protein
MLLSVNLQKSILISFFILVVCVPSFAQTYLPWDSLYATSSGVTVNEMMVPYSGTSAEITNDLELYLDSLAARDLKSTRISGYRILLYSGNERDEATLAREHAYRVFQKADLYTKYQAPTFKVSLGDFYQRLDAFIALKKLEVAFPQAVVVQEIVNLKP